MLKNFHYNWRKTLKLSPKALWLNFGANTLSKLSPQKLFWFCHLKDFKMRSWNPHSADMFGCAWVEYLGNIFFIVYIFYPKWNSIGNHAYGLHYDFSSHAGPPPLIHDIICKQPLTWISLYWSLFFIEFRPLTWKPWKKGENLFVPVTLMCWKLIVLKLCHQLSGKGG